MDTDNTMSFVSSPTPPGAGLSVGSLDAEALCGLASHRTVVMRLGSQQAGWLCEDTGGGGVTTVGFSCSVRTEGDLSESPNPFTL